MNTYLNQMHCPVTHLAIYPLSNIRLSIQCCVSVKLFYEELFCYLKQLNYYDVELSLSFLLARERTMSGD